VDVRVEEHIADLVRVPKRFNSTDLQILLRERYERSHGIYDHQNANDHFALVRHHWCEDTIIASRLRERMEAFVEKRVGHYFNISFTEFLEQPPYVCDLQLEVLSQMAPGQTKEIQDLLDEFSKNNSSKK
jgi:hypothetical protein